MYINLSRVSEAGTLNAPHLSLYSASNKEHMYFKTKEKIGGYVLEDFRSTAQFRSQFDPKVWKKIEYY